MFECFVFLRSIIYLSTHCSMFLDLNHSKQYIHVFYITKDFHHILTTAGTDSLVLSYLLWAQKDIHLGNGRAFF